MERNDKKQFDRKHRGLYELTISSVILTKLVTHPFVGWVVEEMGPYLIQKRQRKPSTNGEMIE